MAKLERRDRDSTTENTKLKEALEMYANRVSVLEVENSNLQ